LPDKVFVRGRLAIPREMAANPAVYNEPEQRRIGVADQKKK